MKRNGFESLWAGFQKPFGGVTMNTLSRSSRVLLAVIATVLVFAALRATEPISLPLFFGVVLLLFFRPLQRRLDRRLPRWAGVLIITLLSLLFLAFLGGLLAYSVNAVAPEVPGYVDEVQSRLQSLQSRLQERGISVSLPGVGEGGGAQGGDTQDGTAQAGGGTSGTSFLSNVLSFFGSFVGGLSLTVLTLTVLIFLLIEANGFREKVGRRLESDTSNRVLDAFERMTGKFERYFLVQTFTSVLTGLLTWLWCWILGVPFSFVWGVVGFTFNFVPTVGSILAVVPPTLFALAFSGVGTGLAVFAGLAVIQLLLGNFVDPALQGSALNLSPVVVLLAVVFWGWLWGIGGAIIGVPLTVALVLLAGEFEATRPIAVFLSEPGEV